MIHGYPGRQLCAGRMAGNENGTPVPAINFRVPIDPSQCPSDVLYLLSPGDFRLQAIVDDRNAYTSVGVKTTDVAVRIGITELQRFVTAFPSAAVNED